MTMKTAPFIVVAMILVHMPVGAGLSHVAATEPEIIEQGGVTK